jgi:CubicO group peptidase (beta-lactamase class C family)
VWCALSAALNCAFAADVKRLDGSRIAPAQIDQAIARLRKAGEVTGIGVTIFNGGKVAYQRAAGFRDAEKKLPFTEISVVTAASFTKVAFAYMVMQLVQEGRLDLDKPVTQYLPKPLPEYPKYKDLAGDSRCANITARMLLSHAAGFPNFRWLNRDRKLNINFEPGSRFAYSGEGIQLLQFVVETIKQTPLQELMQKRVFVPLGMMRRDQCRPLWRTSLASYWA